jgi:hypothetical protein
VRGKDKILIKKERFFRKNDGVSKKEAPLRGLMPFFWVSLPSSTFCHLFS